MKTTLVLIALASITSSVVAADNLGDAKAAANKVSMCIGCHGIPGYRTTYPETYKVPLIGGQTAQYLESALKAYRRGERTHPSMHGIAQSLSDQDIADLAAYYAQQK
jgi:cytochrome c553